MHLIKNIDFESIHLFEVALIGKPYNFCIKGKAGVFIPVYMLVLYEGRNNTVYHNSVLVFENVEYFKCEMAYYGKSFTEFKSRSDIEMIYDGKKPDNAKMFSGLSYFECGPGWSGMLIQFETVHLVYDKYEFDYTEINLEECLKDAELLKKLIYPDLQAIIKLLEEAG